MLCRITGERKHYERAVHFLEVLEQTRCPGYEHFGWGYPFDWVTRTGVMPANTPLITTTPYVYEAFSWVHKLDGSQRWMDIMNSAAEHALRDIRDREISEDIATAGYNPHDSEGGVINASAYRAYMLTSAAIQFGREDYRRAADRNLNFVLRNQQPNGSWFYAADGVRDFVDHFHTCFVLKALAKIEQLTGHEGCRRAIESGVDYYVNNLFDDQGLPKPFSRAPRLTVYRNELYDYAECLNLGVLLWGRFKELDERLRSTLEDLLTRWRKPDGSFRSRRLLLGWDNVPMHRWAQSQVFRSLCFLLYSAKNSEGPA
jgi:squalene cyclase